VKEYEELDGEGTLTAPIFIVRWNGHEYGTRSSINRPYELLDMLTRKLGIPEEDRERWLYEHGEDTWELEIGPAAFKGVGNVHGNRIHGSTDYGRRRDISERIAAAYKKRLREQGFPVQGRPPGSEWVQ
jgi:hypothetical protein